MVRHRLGGLDVVTHDHTTPRICQVRHPKLQGAARQGVPTPNLVGRAYQGLTPRLTSSASTSRVNMVEASQSTNRTQKKFETKLGATLS